MREREGDEGVADVVDALLVEEVVPARGDDHVLPGTTGRIVDEVGHRRGLGASW